MNTRSEKPVHVVFLGGGYVSVWAYRALQRDLRFTSSPSNAEYTVVSSTLYHAFHGWTGESLGGIISDAHRLTPLQSLMPSARFIQGMAVSIDLSSQMVAVQLNGRRHIDYLPYDHLVFGIGSQDKAEHIKNLNRYGWQLKAPGRVAALRNHLLENIKRARRAHDVTLGQHLLTVVIAGGGFAGVEMCAAIAELYRLALKRYPDLQDTPPRIILVHSGEALLPHIRPRFSKVANYATQQLKIYGVEILLNTRVVEVEPDGVVLSSGEFIPTHTFVSTIGQTVVSIPGTEQLPRANDGRIMTDSCLRVQGYKNLWAGGDTAFVIHPHTQRWCPATALWAIKQGTRIGRNLARSLRQKRLKQFASLELGHAASLGIGKGAGEVLGVQITGWVAWFLRLLVFLFFMPGKIQAFKVLLDVCLLPFRGRAWEPSYQDEVQSVQHAVTGELMPEANVEIV